MAKNVMRPGHGPGWTAYEPPEDEILANQVAGAVSGFVHDCRLFARLAEEARLGNLNERLGLSWDEFCLRHLKQPAEVVEAILVGVKVLGEEAPVPAEVARRVGARVLSKRGRPRKGEEKGADSTLSTRGSTQATYLRARLARDHPAVLEALERGEYPSVRAAGIAAGIVKVPTALELLHRAWEKASEGERRAFLFDGPVSRVIAKLMEE